MSCSRELRREDSQMRITILDPTATPPEAAAHDEPAAGPLAGKTVGIRRDRAWRSFDWVSDEWEHALRALGAGVTTWVAGNRIGEEGERTRDELERFAAGVDLAVVGLGN
jgi:hypothetical protein